MAYEIRAFQVTIPPGTLASAPQITDTPFPPRIVREVEITVPPGPSGQVGFAIGVNGVNILPYGPGAWIVTDNEKINWTLEDQIESGAWQLIGYNTGQYSHTIYVRYLLDTVDSPQAANSGVLISNTDLSGSLSGGG